MGSPPFDGLLKTVGYRQHFAEKNSFSVKNRFFCFNKIIYFCPLEIK